MREFEFTIHGNKYSVEIKNVESNIATVEVNGTTYEVEIHKEFKQPKTPKLVRQEVKSSNKGFEETKQESKSKGGGGGAKIQAPLPGTILDLHVKAGDQVKKGQKVITMEAMKMENSVQADKDGTVKDIKVSEGESVLQEDVLIEME